MKATPGYQPGQRTPAPPCKRDENGQLVRRMLDKHELRRDVLLTVATAGKLSGDMGLHAMARAKLDPAEERIRRMAARPG